MGDLGAPGTLFGGPRELCRAPRELFGSSRVILELLGTILEAFWDYFRDLFLSLLRVLWKPAFSSVLVVLGTFWFTSFAKFAKWQGSFPLDHF